jgi:hypothetical protein
LQKILKDLRSHVKTFQRHTSQINTFIDKRKDVPQREQQHLAMYSVEDCQRIQKAAIELYQALIKACMVHPEHLIHFRIEANHATNARPSFVRFQLAITQSLISASTEPIWLAIETTFGSLTRVLGPGEMEQVEDSVITLRNSLKRLHEMPPTNSSVKKAKTQKSVRFSASTCVQMDVVRGFQHPQHLLGLANAIMSPWDRLPPSSPPPLSPSRKKSTIAGNLDSNSMEIAEASLPDFCEKHDFCNHISKRSQKAGRTSDECVGYLSKKGLCQHRVLLGPQDANLPKTPVSLAQLVSQISEKPYTGRFLYVDSFRLAKQLASAILQFHATPLLEETWQSDDIVFFNGDLHHRCRRPTLTDPHLSVRVTRQTSCNSSQNTASPRDSRIRNFYTYRLGIILIELACQAPLCKLRESEDLITSEDRNLTDFEMASLISETLCTDMGIPFQRMVQKCLACDFGHGRDLDDPSLQTAFHKEVVCELEKIEARVSKLHLGH